MTVLFVLYAVAGYWAAGVIHENQIWLGTASNLFLKKLIEGLLFGWIYIPIALIKRLIKK